MEQKESVTDDWKKRHNCGAADHIEDTKTLNKTEPDFIFLVLDLYGIEKCEEHKHKQKPLTFKIT